MRQSNGFILLTAVLMMALLSLLVLSQMQGVLLQVKALRHRVERSRIQNDLEQAAAQLLHSPARRCVHPGDKPQAMLTLLQQRGGCAYHYHERRFRYVFESLGVVPCLNTREGRRSTQHWRLTLATDDAHPALLQLRFAEAVALVPCNEAKETLVKTGILSWRRLG